MSSYPKRGSSQACPGQTDKSVVSQQPGTLVSSRVAKNQPMKAAQRRLDRDWAIVNVDYCRRVRSTERALRGTKSASGVVGKPGFTAFALACWGDELPLWRAAALWLRSATGAYSALAGQRTGVGPSSTTIHPLNSARQRKAPE